MFNFGADLKIAIRYLLLAIKGLFVGAVDVLPGISGGTIALILGVYSELIHSINSVSLSSLQIFKKKGVITFWKSINGNFLLPFFTGMIVGILALARIIEWLFEEYPVLLWSFFLGLLLMSVFYLLKGVKINSLIVFQLVLSTIITLYLNTLGIANSVDSYLYIFFCGSIGIIAMILPGISGAYILILLGIYTYIIEHINQFTNHFLMFSNPLFVESLTVLLIFLAGVIIGLKLFARLFSTMLKKYPNTSYAILTGVMIGVLYRIWPWQNQIPTLDTDNFKAQLVWPSQYDSEPQILGAILLFLCGFSFIIILQNQKLILMETIDGE